ncbi:MAG TPA: type II secretion system protein N [Usitatibacter sp.]|nr:type II secretion system protein N [Usitatibacter sp.]
MRRAAIVVLGILAFLVFLVATVPASFVVSRFHRVEAVQLSDVRGTLWDGAARARVLLPGGAVEIEELGWRFAPARLIAGRIAFDVVARDPRLDATLQLAHGLGGIEARDVKAKGDAALVGAALPLLATWRPEGRVVLEAPLLTWDERDLRGNARAEWQRAVLSFPDARALGTYVVEMRGDGGPMKVTLTTTEGLLRLAGEGTYSPPTRLALRGEARAQPAATDTLEPLLNLLGPRRADGARSFDWRTP